MTPAAAPVVTARASGIDVARLPVTEPLSPFGLVFALLVIGAFWIAAFALIRAVWAILELWGAR